MATLRVTTIPSADNAFRVHVESAVARIRDATPARLADEIRRAYPNASVSVGSPLGGIGDPGPRWYVYREAHAIPHPGDPAWWHDVSLPRTVVGADGRYVKATDGACELFGVAREGIIGARAGAFTRHEDDPELGARLLEELRRRGELTSTAVVVRPEGAEVRIEFHTRLEGDGSSTTVMRVAGET